MIPKQRVKLLFYKIQSRSPADRRIRAAGYFNKFTFCRKGCAVLDKLMQQLNVAALQVSGDRTA